jgi:hypothetical protein
LSFHITYGNTKKQIRFKSKLERVSDSWENNQNVPVNWIDMEGGIQKVTQFLILYIETRKNMSTLKIKTVKEEQKTQYENG